MKYLDLLSAGIWAGWFILTLTGHVVPNKEDFLFASGCAALFALACYSKYD